MEPWYLSVIIGVVLLGIVMFTIQGIQKSKTNGLSREMQPHMEKLKTEDARDFLIAATAKYWNNDPYSKYLLEDENIPLRIVRVLGRKNLRVLEQFEAFFADAGVDFKHITPSKGSDENYEVGKVAKAFYSGEKTMNSVFYDRIISKQKGDGFLDIINVKYGRNAKTVFNLENPIQKKLHDQILQQLFETIRQINNNDMSKSIKMVLTSPRIASQSAVEVYGTGRNFVQFEEDYTKLVVYRTGQIGRYFHIIGSEKYVNLTFVVKDIFTQEGHISSELLEGTEKFSK